MGTYPPAAWCCVMQHLREAPPPHCAPVRYMLIGMGGVKGESPVIGLYPVVVSGNYYIGTGYASIGVCVGRGPPTW